MVQLGPTVSTNNLLLLPRAADVTGFKELSKKKGWDEKGGGGVAICSLSSIRGPSMCGVFSWKLWVASVEVFKISLVGKRNKFDS